MKLLHDLRRRRVFRLAGLYIVGAWVVIQVAEALFQAWGIPETAMRFIFIAAALCFPIALVFGWIFDITSEGIVRTAQASAGDAVPMHLQKTDYAILAALVAVGVVVMLGSAERIQEVIQSGDTETATTERREYSIAVFPFKNLDTNVETGYFSDGVTEEILHRLSSLGALHVLSSGSSFSFRDSDQTPAELSKLLGVRYLLDGSIRRIQNRVRVTARLLDEAGFQVWTDTYDRELTQIFAVQTEIANAVSRQIVAEIVPLDALPAGRTTDNMEAYNAYLLGRYEADRRTGGWKQRAEEAFLKAIDLDPGFAPPYAGLAIVVVNSGSGPHWDEARANAEKALELDPELAEAHAFVGLVETLFGDPKIGALSLERAINLDPSYSSSYAWLAIALSRQGRGEDAREALYRGLEKDPFNPIVVVNLADQEESRGNFDAAEQLLLRLTGLPQVSGPSMDILELYHDWGRYADELAIRMKIMRKLGPDSIEQLAMLARNYAALGMTDDANYWLERSQAVDPGSPFGVADQYFTRKLYEDQSALRAYLESAESPELIEDVLVRAMFLGYGGLAQIQIGEHATGINWLERSLEYYRQDYAPDTPANSIDVLIYDEEWFTWLVVHLFQRLAFGYMQVDRPDDAASILQQLDTVLDMGSMHMPVLFEWLALQHGLKGDIDGAYEALRKAVDLGWANYYEIANDPAWAKIIEDERVADLLVIARLRVEEQRGEVEALDQSADFRTEINDLLGP